MNLSFSKFISKITVRQEKRNGLSSVLTDDLYMSELDFVDDMSKEQKEELNFVDESEENIDGNPFLYSLENLTPEDIPLTKPKSKPTFAEKISGGLRIIMLIISAAVFVVCSVMLVDNLIQKQKANDYYTSLASEFDFAALSEQIMDGSIQGVDDYNSAILLLSPLMQDDTLVDVTTKIEAAEEAKIEALPQIEIKTKNTEVEKMKAQLNALALKNPDTYGWIYVPETTIKYPIVQGVDNDHYLHYSFDNKRLVVGSIYADYRCNKEILRNYNTVIYGHNITDGSMFNHVTKFLKEDMFNNTLIYIYTFDGAYVYEPFAIYETRADYLYFRMEFTSGDDFVSFANEVQANSKFNKNMTFTKDDRIITLSTCTNGASIGRYALHAKLVNIIK